VDELTFKASLEPKEQIYKFFSFRKENAGIGNKAKKIAEELLLQAIKFFLLPSIFLGNRRMK